MLVIENKEEDEVDSPEVPSNQLRSRSAMQIKRNLNERPVLTLDQQTPQSVMNAYFASPTMAAG